MKITKEFIDNDEEFNAAKRLAFSLDNNNFHRLKHNGFRTGYIAMKTGGRTYVANLEITNFTHVIMNTPAVEVFEHDNN